jgi:CheY-like chemotaxis protein
MKRAIDILHIEDNDVDVAMILHELNKYWPKINHHRVEQLSALEEALSRKWDVIISDFTLPEFDGLTALRMVRENEIDTPFIVVSGRVEEDIAASMMRLGANDYVMKDNLKRLAPAIERELKTAEDRAESGLKLSGAIKYESVLKKPESNFDKRIEPNNITPAITRAHNKLGLSNADFIKERHKAVINILYAANLIRKTQETILDREDLSEPQFNILCILRRQSPNPVSLRMIRDEVSNKTIDISRTVDKMVKADLVNYSVSTEDKRIRNISISKQGSEALMEIDKYADEMFLCDALLSEEQSRQINLGLQQMLAAMR